MGQYFQSFKLLAVLTLGYGLFYFANNLSTEFLYLTPGAHLVHLPSGIKILMTLIAGPIGALAIFIVSNVWGVLIPFPGQFGLVFLLSIGSAGVPWLVCKICAEKFRLHGDLSNLTIRALVSISLSYAILNSLVTQSILYLGGESPDLWGGIGVMVLGDLTGILLIVSLARLLAPSIKARASRLDHDQG
ncbi:hypothetical protein [Polynucleobacter sp. AP-Latsch-80-C2]|jgi:hypothetical protein|uniref:hypothetical protein n=1 Tax=Polynucleobacter sp. AP-Latsch-80-C2 TaxID=2576931 RepID=UPI001C0ACFB7|nr:hypothetical protein [Polynucleobacter sp. AP-Latsch-80-C2]MBU3622717.1 hypothetical protein [Polynucleobacter sp. AP-Latsch-80-C2]